MTHIRDDVVQDHDHQFEVPREPFQLFGVFVHKLSSLDVVHLSVLLDKVLADGVNVVNDHKFDLLFVDASCQIDEKFEILVNAVHVMHVDSIPHVVLRDGRILQEVVLHLVEPFLV